MKYKIAILGPKNIISGFKALGVIPFNVENGENALMVLKKIKKDLENKNEKGDGDLFATVIIMEDIYAQIPEKEINKITKGALPAIVSLPGLEGSHGAGVMKLRRLAEKAVGSDILG